MNKRIKKKKLKQAMLQYKNFSEAINILIEAMNKLIAELPNLISNFLKDVELALNEECKTDNNISIGIAEKSAHENIERV